MSTAAGHRRRTLAWMRVITLIFAACLSTIKAALAFAPR